MDIIVDKTDALADTADVRVREIGLTVVVPLRCQEIEV